MSSWVEKRRKLRYCLENFKFEMLFRYSDEVVKNRVRCNKVEIRGKVKASEKYVFGTP